ncbi:hypothetical protein M728_003931 (plasmid) [Ensifer sp. WSM1721]|nr:hypothetical protein [Ensifer sp. WSM1721]
MIGTFSPRLARQLELATPDADSVVTRELFSSAIAVSFPIHRIAVLDQPAIELGAVGAKADTHEPLIH